MQYSFSLWALFQLSKQIPEDSTSSADAPEHGLVREGFSYPFKFVRNTKVNRFTNEIERAVWLGARFPSMSE